MSTIVLYTDGSSRGNPGPGGYGAVLMYGHHHKELSQGFRLTTNNRMELLAVIAGLEAIKKNELPITVYSDSQYVVNAVEKGWLNTWIKTDFKGGKYDTLTQRITLDYYETDLTKIAREITQITEYNIILSPQIATRKVSAYVENMPFEGAIEQFAFSNDLKVRGTESGYYILEPKRHVFAKH